MISITFYKVTEKIPIFDSDGWAHQLLFWDGDTLYSGSCQLRGVNPVFVDWWSGGGDVNAQWWAHWPEKPGSMRTKNTNQKGEGQE